MIVSLMFILILSVSVVAQTPCLEHYDCLKYQYCDRVNTYTCQACKDCTVYRREFGYRTCVEIVLSDCGPCQDGYHEDREYFTDERVETCAPNKADHTWAHKSMVMFVLLVIISVLNSQVVLTSS